MYTYMYAYMQVCGARARARVCVCVCVCVRERERERECVRACPPSPPYPPTACVFSTFIFFSFSFPSRFSQPVLFESCLTKESESE